MARSRRRKAYRKDRRWNPSGRRRGMRGGRFAKGKHLRLVTSGPGRYLNSSRDWEEEGRRAAEYVKKYGWPDQGGYQGNPRGRSSRASRARTWHKQVRSSLPWWEKGRNPRGHRGHRRKNRRPFWRRMVVSRHGGSRPVRPKTVRQSRAKYRHQRSRPRRNPKGRYYGGRKSTRRRKNPRSSSYYRARRHLKSLPRSRRKHVVSYALGSMNPRRRRSRRGRR
jgi:hypothetical protein